MLHKYLKGVAVMDFDSRESDRGRLIQLLREGNESERMLSAKRLGEMRDSNAVAPLVNALNDPHQYVRSWAAWALGEIGESSSVDPLIDALTKYSDISVTDYLGNESRCLPDIYLSLEKLTCERFGLDVEKWRSWQRSRCRKL
jgi:HEAT repeat protein